MPMKIESEETAESKAEVNGIEAGDEDVFARLTGEDTMYVSLLCLLINLVWDDISDALFSVTVL